MKKQGQSDVGVLLGVLLIFSISIVILVSNINIQRRNDAPHQSATIEDQSMRHAVAQIAPFLHAHAIEQVAQQIIYFVPSIPNAIRLFGDYAIDPKSPLQSPLTDFEKVELLTALLYYGAWEKNENLNDLFAWIMSHEELFDHNPLLFVAVQTPYVSIITSLNHDNLLTADQITDAFKKIIETNNLALAQQLINVGIKITPSLATDLLIQAVQTNKQTNFLPFLIEHGADKKFIRL